MYVIILCIHVYACKPPYCCGLALIPRKNDWRSEFFWNTSFLQIHDLVPNHGFIRKLLSFKSMIWYKSEHFFFTNP